MVLKTDRGARVFALLAALILLWAAPASAGPSSAAEFKVAVEYYKLPNGSGGCSRRTILRRQFAWRVLPGWVSHEPRDRTGFAHLFEHMMFQGSQNLGKMEFIKLVQQKRRDPDGSTRFDFTNYFEVLRRQTGNGSLGGIGPHGRAGCDEEN